MSTGMFARMSEEEAAQFGYDFVKNEKYDPATRQEFGGYNGEFLWMSLDAWGRERTEEIYDEVINLAPDSELAQGMIKSRKEYLDGNDPALQNSEE
jgi:hypothetical protein